VIYAPHDRLRVSERIRAIIGETLEMAPEVRLLFVTNIRTGEFADLGPEGVMNTAQYYTRQQADEMVRSFRELGLTVEPYFSEVDLIEALLDGNESDLRRRIVYTTAEGGSGSGRRALIPALCNLLGVPLLNSGAHAATLVRHKFHAYSVLRQVDVRMPESWLYRQSGWLGGLAPTTGTRVIVKPVYESMGIGVDDDSVRLVDDGFDAFVTEKIAKFGQPAIVQEFVSGEEVGVPVARVGTTTIALPPIVQRRANGDMYDQLPKTFRNEHIERDLSHAPFEGSSVQLKALSAAAVLAFDSLEMKGVGRIDFRIDADGRQWAFDTNGEPPPLPKTCWSQAMGLLGFSLREMLAFWVGLGLLEHPDSGVGPEGQLATRE
jgi:D-alanine-D-alanine ligase